MSFIHFVLTKERQCYKLFFIQNILPKLEKLAKKHFRGKFIDYLEVRSTKMSQ
jgi:hypothetical protein